MALGKDVHVKGLGFIAPQISGKSNVSSPHVGEIIFDSSDSTFYGQDGTGWATLSSGSATAIPSGAVLPYAGSTAPTGYLIADGSAVSRTTYANLFAAIGTAFGEGDGSSTFNLPDLRGRFIRGVDGTAGRDPDSSTRTAMNSGGNTGNNVGSVQADEFASHTHTVTVDSYAGSGILGNFAHWSGANTHEGTSSATSNAAGGNETRPLNAYMTYIIKI